MEERPAGRARGPGTSSSRAAPPFEGEHRPTLASGTAPRTQRPSGLGLQLRCRRLDLVGARLPVPVTATHDPADTRTDAQPKRVVDLAPAHATLEHRQDLRCRLAAGLSERERANGPADAHLGRQRLEGRRGRRDPGRLELGDDGGYVSRGRRAFGRLGCLWRVRSFGCLRGFWLCFEASGASEALAGLPALDGCRLAIARWGSPLPTAPAMGRGCSPRPYRPRARQRPWPSRSPMASPRGPIESWRLRAFGPPELLRSYRVRARPGARIGSPHCGHLKKRPGDSFVTEPIAKLWTLIAQSPGSTWNLGPGPAPSGRTPASTWPACSSPTIAATSGRGSTAPLA